jgi:hypothetical protein
MWSYLFIGRLLRIHNKNISRHGTTGINLVFTKGYVVGKSEQDLQKKTSDENIYFLSVGVFRKRRFGAIIFIDILVVYANSYTLLTTGLRVSFLN